MVKLQAIPFTIHNQHWNTSWYIYWLSPTTNSSCSVKYSNYSCLAVPSWISTWRKLWEVALPKAFPGLMKQEGECTIQANMIVSCDKCMEINPTKYELASFSFMVTPPPPPPPHTHTHTHSKQNRAVSVAVRKPHGYTSKASMKAKFTVIFNSSTPNTAANQVSINTDNGLSFGDKPLSKPMLGYCELDHYEHTSVKF